MDSPAMLLSLLWPISSWRGCGGSGLEVNTGESSPADPSRSLSVLDAQDQSRTVGFINKHIKLDLKQRNSVQLQLLASPYIT